MATNKGASGETVFCRLQLSQRIQNFVVLWLDASIDESTPEFKESLAQLRESVGTSIQIFKDANDCTREIQETMNQKVLLIVSGNVGQKIVPKIHELPQVESIYVLCGEKSVHEGWAKKISKVKAVCTDIKSICEGLKHDRQLCDKIMTPISIQNCDPLFMYTQLVKEAILQIDYDDVESIKQFAEFCRKKGGFDATQIKDFETQYVKEKVIWWYTKQTFVYSMVNCALREFDVEILMKAGFFMGHLHRQIQKLSEEQYADPQGLKIMRKKQFQLYRGQGLPKKKFENLNQSIGGLMSFNNFLSTTYKKDISLIFAGESASSEGNVGILFVMQIDGDLCKKSNIPFVEIIGDIGCYQDSEAEILFTTHTLFRIESVQQIVDRCTDRLYQVNLTMVSPDTQELHKVAESMRKELDTRTGLSSLGLILLRAGQPEQAKGIYHALLEKDATDDDIAEYNYQLGWVYNDLREYANAIHYYELALEYMKKTLPPNDIQFAQTYNNIGLVYSNMHEYPKALSLQQQSLEIWKKVSPQNHLGLAASYGNIGNAYMSMRENSKALSSHQQSLEIFERHHPPNHPDLASSYYNIGVVYNNMDNYSKALSYYQKSLEMRRISLPEGHPETKKTLASIELVKKKMQDSVVSPK